MSAQYEIFEAAKKNDLKRVKELLDSGVDVNLKDWDTGSTPLIYACSNGSKQTMELLIERGAEINVQNERGITPLHTLITKRYDAIALWLVKQGADIHLQDRRGHSPRDLALGFLQKELDETAANRNSQPKTAQTNNTTTNSLSSSQKVETKPAKEDNIKVYFSTGNSGSYKTIKITNQTLAGEVVKAMSERMNMIQHLGSLDLVEVRKESHRKVGKDENVNDLRAKWPLIFGASGNETHLHYYFYIKLRFGAPEEAEKLYKAAQVGS